MYYSIIDSPRNEGKDFFEINEHTGEIFTKKTFDREYKQAYALEVAARDGAPSSRTHSDGQPNTGEATPGGGGEGRRTGDVKTGNFR